MGLGLGGGFFGFGFRRRRLGCGGVGGGNFLQGDFLGRKFLDRGLRRRLGLFFRWRGARRDCLRLRAPSSKSHD